MKIAAFAVGLAAVVLSGCVYHHETVRERPSPPPREEQLAGAMPDSDTALAHLDVSGGAALAAPRRAETGISP